MSDVLGPGARTRARRLPEKAAYDEATIFSILDAALLCHVAGIVEGLAMTLPTLHQRVGRTIYVHASKSNALLRAVLTVGEASLSVTHFDGLRLARSGFESSIAYRSVVVVGPVREITDPGEKLRVLNGFVDVVLPGRAREVRPISAREANLTMVVALHIDEAVAKVSQGPTSDDPEDAARAIWAGTIPARVTYGDPVPDVNGAMSTGEVTLSPSVRRLLGDA